MTNVNKSNDVSEQDPSEQSPDVGKHMPKEEALDSCPECEETEVVKNEKRGETVCRNCGLVIGESCVDRGPERNMYTSEDREKKSRTGAPLTMMQHDQGLSATIGTDSTDYNGKAIPSDKKRKISRWRNWHSRSRRSSAVDRNLAIALGELDRMSSQLDVPKPLREQTAKLYRKIVKKGLVKGRSIESVVASTMYATCRKLKVPRTLDEIAEVARVDKKNLSRTYRYIVDEMDLEIYPPEPEEYVPRFATELGAPYSVVKEAEEILEKIDGAPFTYGKSPTSIAAAAIYIAGKDLEEPITQREIAVVSRTTEVTVRNRYKDIQEKLDMA